MEFSILGPLEVRADGCAIALGGTKPRALLAVLLLHANEPVSAERLALALWGEDAPPGALKTVQVHVSRLRRALGDPDVLATRPAGYSVRVRAGALDAERFEQCVTAGRAALAAGDADTAGAVLREALALWRGPPLAELAGMPFAPAEIARLEEERVGALELRVEADLAAGRHSELVPELGRLTQSHPWRERLHGQRMLALYRSGRQADALEAYREARQVLVDQLGIEPGDELAELHRAMLARDRDLAAPPRHRAVDRDGRLPGLPNRTIGRASEIAKVAGRLRDGDVRLLTLTGPGGVGKTRLAIEVARAAEADFADGAWFAPLAALRRVEDVPMATVGALGVVVLDGESAEQAVLRFAGAKQLLLVVDNCEHLPGLGPIIGRMLAACPGLTALATSREPLSVRAEVLQPVPSLALPEQAAAPTGEDAVTLFVERARAHDPEFEGEDGNAAAVVEICRRVDGLPLAIELAAARCALLSPIEIAQRLDTALGALGAGARDAPARQRTLRATIDWSHDLLDDGEKACFARFAVFVGGATVDAAEAVTGAPLDTLDRLVAKSLLARRRQPGGRSRLTMLEMIREYAGERFEAEADAEAVRERHFRHFLSLAKRSASERALWGTGRREHLGQLDADIDNLHGALGWAVARADGGSALAMCVALGRYWLMRDRYADAVAWIDKTLELPGIEAHPALRIDVLCTKSWAAFPLGRRAEQPELMSEAEELARTIGDPALLSDVRQARAAQEIGQGNLELADRLADDALGFARGAGDDWRLAMAAWAKAMAARDPADLRELVDGAVALLERVGNVYYVADLLASAAYAALCQRSDVDAAEFVARATPLTRDLENPYLWMLLRGNAGLAALFTGDADAARDAFREELELSRKTAVLPFAGEGLAGLAALATLRGDLERAAWLHGAAETHRYGQPQDPVDERLRATFFDPALVRLGAEAWDAAARHGAATSFEDAIADALEEESAATAAGSPSLENTRACRPGWPAPS